MDQFGCNLLKKALATWQHAFPSIALYDIFAWVRMHRNQVFYQSFWTRNILVPEAALLLVSTKNRHLGQRSRFLVLTKRSAAAGDENRRESDLRLWAFPFFRCFFLPFLSLLFLSFCCSDWPSTGLASRSKTSEKESSRRAIFCFGVDTCLSLYLYISSCHKAHIRFWNRLSIHSCLLLKLWLPPSCSPFVFNHSPPSCFWSTWSAPPPLWSPLQCRTAVFLPVLLRCSSLNGVWSNHLLRSLL